MPRGLRECGPPRPPRPGWWCSKSSTADAGRCVRSVNSWPLLQERTVPGLRRCDGIRDGPHSSSPVVGVGETRSPDPPRTFGESCASVQARVNIRSDSLRFEEHTLEVPFQRSPHSPRTVTDALAGARTPRKFGLYAVGRRAHAAQREMDRRGGWIRDRMERRHEHTSSAAGRVAKCRPVVPHRCAHCVTEPRQGPLTATIATFALVATVAISRNLQ